MATVALSTPSHTIYRDKRGFHTLREEWNDLLARSRFNSIFLTWEWQTTWWDSFGEGELLLIAFRGLANELIGIAPLHCHCHADGCRIEMIGGTEVADYLDIIIATGYEPEVYSGFLQFLTSSAVPPWDSVDLRNLHQSSRAPGLLPGLATQLGLKIKVAQEDVAPGLILPPTFDEYLNSLDKKQRHEIRRKRNKLEREASDWRWFQIRGGDDLDSWVARFLELHQMASAAKEAFMTEEMTAFFHRIAHMAAAQDWLSLAFIEIADTLAATVFNFDYNNRIWVYNSGYNPNVFSALSPGIVLNSYLIEDAIAAGRAEFDFLQGDEVYKYRFGATDAQVMRVTLTP